MPAAFKIAYVELRTFCHATEEPDRVLAALRSVAGPDVDVTSIESVGHHGNKIRILTGRLEGRAAIDGFLRRVLEGPETADLVSDIGPRLDEEGGIFLRFSKQAAYGGDLRLAADDDVVQVRVKAVTFPQARDRVLAGFAAYVRALQAP
ncbi:MAG: RNA-binding domain-containing protein [Methanobacteriota archaeon]